MRSQFILIYISTISISMQCWILNKQQKAFEKVETRLEYEWYLQQKLSECSRHGIFSQSQEFHNKYIAVMIKIISKYITHFLNVSFCEQSQISNESRHSEFGITIKLLICSSPTSSKPLWFWKLRNIQQNNTPNSLTFSRTFSISIYKMRKLYILFTTQQFYWVLMFVYAPRYAPLETCFMDS